MRSGIFSPMTYDGSYPLLYDDVGTGIATVALDHSTLGNPPPNPRGLPVSRRNLELPRNPFGRPLDYLNLDIEGHDPTVCVGLSEVSADESRYPGLAHFAFCRYSHFMGIT